MPLTKRVYPGTEALRPLWRAATAQRKRASAVFRDALGCGEAEQLHRYGEA
jgi:hypothetical protein